MEEANVEWSAATLAWISPTSENRSAQASTWRAAGCRCIFSSCGAKAYSFSFDGNDGRCYIKEDVLFKDDGPSAKDIVSSHMTWFGARRSPPPFTIYWNEMFESGDAITRGRRAGACGRRQAAGA